MLAPVPVVERTAIASVVDILVSAAAAAAPFEADQSDKATGRVEAVAVVLEILPNLRRDLKAPVVVIRRRAEVEAGRVAAPSKELRRGARAHAQPHLTVHLAKVDTDFVADASLRQKADAYRIALTGDPRLGIEDAERVHSAGFGGGRQTLTSGLFTGTIEP